MNFFPEKINAEIVSAKFSGNDLFIKRKPETLDSLCESLKAALKKPLGVEKKR